MTATELMADLRQRGFSFHPENGALRITPASRLTTADRDLIRLHRDEILKLAAGSPPIAEKPSIPSTSSTNARGAGASGEKQGISADAFCGRFSDQGSVGAEKPSTETVHKPPEGPADDNSIEATGVGGADSTWPNHAEAERLLADHRTELARLERQLPGGRFPPITARLVADGLKIAEGYIRDHALERARGWDPMELLRDMLAQNIAFARRARQEGDGQ